MTEYFIDKSVKTNVSCSIQENHEKLKNMILLYKYAIVCTKKLENLVNKFSCNTLKESPCRIYNGVHVIHCIHNK